MPQLSQEWTPHLISRQRGSQLSGRADRQTVVSGAEVPHQGAVVDGDQEEGADRVADAVGPDGV